MHYVSPHHCIVTFEGPDAQSFLQSQLTNDVSALNVGDWQWQGYCNSKGRLHATFALARTGEATFHAVVHASTAAFVVKRLSMFRLRSKLTIALSESLVAMHHLNEPAANLQSVATLHLGNNRWVSIEQASGDSQTPSEPMQENVWRRIGIESRQPEIVSATNETFVPQMIGFDAIQPGGGVSFSKGCYPGQEVVARAHYRGAVKRRLAIETVSDTVLPGTTITRADGQEVDVVNVAAMADTTTCIALVVEPIPAG